MSNIVFICFINRVGVDDENYSIRLKNYLKHYSFYFFNTLLGINIHQGRNCGEDLPRPRNF